MAMKSSNMKLGEMIAEAAHTTELQKPKTGESTGTEIDTTGAPETTPAPALTIKTENGTPQIGVDHPDVKIGLHQLMAAVGTTDMKFFNGLIGQLVDAGSKNGQPAEEIVNFTLSAITGVEPRDQVEAMLAAQMAVIHAHTMAAAKKLMNAECPEQQDSAERALNRLARTFTKQMEALRKYRNGGEQKVTVEHVTVNSGGQAIIGNVETGGRGYEKR